MESTSRGIIHQGNSTISIEMLPEYPHPVVVKKPSKRHASRRSIRSLATEYEMTRSLNEVEGVRKALEQRSIKSQPVLILEYIDGETLRDLIARESLDLRTKLGIAVQVTRILGSIHQRDVVHLDLNSRNILIGHEREAVHLIDLGAAFGIDGSGHLKVRPDQILGMLPYISPEQTGRINRAVDERSDLYSLGVVLYELMTGRLPFDSDNPLELIHHHIALTPVSPSAVSSDIPEVVSAIVLKLLKKDAEDRYQSAAGVEVDLETCLQRLAPGDSIEGFPVGKADSTSRFKFPQALYGRDRELKVLEGAFESARRDTSAVVFVCGYSGIGKTALVEEIQRPVSEKRGYFIKGKFDQYLKTTPYAGLTQAFTEFASQILTEPEKNFTDWKSRIQSAVGDLGGVLTGIIPTLEMVIGAQPTVPHLGGQEAENRFNYVFINFLSRIATEDHPLVLFLDDLQWIDAASLRALAVIQSDLNQPGLLVIGAYRDNEVDPPHPLMGMLRDQEDVEQRPQILKLANLQQQDLRAFLADTLRSETGVTELAAAIHDKTLGNPFFSRRLLSSLYDADHIRYDLDSKSWQWAIGDLNVATVADNVADLLAQTLSHLPEAQRHLLNLAACIGNRFDLPTLARISGRTEHEVARLLTAFVHNRYIVGSESGYGFVHDLVQKAAYTLTDAKRRAGTHLTIGRQLLADMSDVELEERIFAVVNQYNLGVELLTDRDEAVKLAILNLQAGRKSRASSAFAAAAEYLERSASLLGERKWQDHYRLILTVYSELIEACHLNQRKEDVSTLFGTLLEHVTEDVDLRGAYKTMIMQKIGDSDLSEAIALAAHYLETLNIGFDDARHSDMSVDELYALPPMEDREKLAALDILLTITTPVIFAAPARLPSVIYTMLNLISRYGNSGMAGVAYAWYAMHLCLVQQYHEGNLFGKLGVDLFAKYPTPGIASKIMDIQYAWVRHWESPAHDLIAPLKTYFHVGMEEGDFEWGLYCLLNHALLLWGAGEPLELFMAEAEPGIELSKSKNQEVTLFMFLLFAQSAINLTVTAGDPTRLEGKWFSEQQMMSSLEGNHLLLALYGLLKITLSYLFGNPGEACQHIEDTLKYRSSLNPHYLYSKISFYGALSCVAELASATDDADTESRLEQLKQFERELELWAEVAPMNYEHEYHLLQAEKARVADDPWKAVQLYERAINGARENRFVHEEALAKELYARFWQKCGNDGIAAMYMREARVLYHQWGAAAKVRQLENRYPQWLGAGSIPDEDSGAARKAATSLSQPITSIGMDLDGLVAASQTLSSETNLEQLLGKMMDLVMASSGAARAVLLLRQEGNWFIRAQGDVADGKCEALHDQPFDPARGQSEAGPVPGSVFAYCQRSGEALVVGDARSDPRFAEDRIIQTRNIKSMACLPVLSRGKREAMLYLENRELAGAFTSDRVELLEHLSAQFAISLENAALCEDVKHKFHELQTSEERFRCLMEQSPLAIEVLTPDGKISQINRAWLRLWGVNEEEAKQVTANYNMLTDKQAQDLGVGPLIRKAFAGEFVVLPPIEYSACRTADDLDVDLVGGRAPWIRCHLSPIKDEHGEILFVLNTYVDISEHIHAEKALTQAERRYRTVADFTYGWEWWSDSEGKLLYVSPSCERITGYSPEDFVGNSHLINEIILREDRSLWEKHRHAVDAQGGLQEIQFRIKRRDGAIRWIEHICQPVTDGGESLGIRASNRDITERRTTEEALRLSERRLLQAQRIAGLGFVRWDLKTNAIEWSDEVYRIYGVDPHKQEVTLEYTGNLVHPDDLDYVRKNFELAIDGKRRYDLNHRVVRPDGEIVWVHATAELVLDKDGKPDLLLGTVLDITERKKAEEKAQRHQETLARVDRATSLGLLTGSIAHELNQPLTGVLSNAQAAEMMIRSGRWEPDELAEIMAEIVADTKRGGEVIRNLRELFREQEGEFESIDINAVVGETMRLLRSEFIKQHVTCASECAASVPRVEGNKIQLQQVLVNLIMNGIQAMSDSPRPERRLRIATAYDADEVKAWVEDRGPGIDVNIIDRIFEPLATWKPGGTGMGLAISNSIIRSHGGRVFVENRRDGGAHIGFAIPVQTEGQGDE